ncbi:MAG: 3-dehydroquinate synthase [Clostridiales Family XIII bacterium]|jgi:3-dehydroquinate synthase|nr:3-dehydroquinate synthase [Clostridiales Family XIII bacterium]
MKTLHVPLGGRAYDIHIEAGALRRLPALTAAFLTAGEPVAVVSDETVWALYGQTVCEDLRDAGLAFEHILVPPGESSKCMAQLSRLWERFGNMGLGRAGTVVALGGGVVGDLAGFAAATWMRGVGLIQAPTTLLAQVDSAVGGKTAIDIDAGKNLVGAFHQPKSVIIDPRALATLPPREYATGMAEVVKYGAIASADLFARLETEELRENAATDTLRDIIYECCRIKRDVVAGDEFDTGRRMLLNFGHTFGHAIEAKYGYSRYNHGEGVAAGMRIAARIGETLGVTRPGTAQRLSRLLSRYGLDAREGTDGLLPLVRRDKKASGAGVKLALLKEIGAATVQHLSYTELEAALRTLKQVG